MRHLNYGHLQYFWTVAREGGVARAAEALHVTPQTISGQLRLLEEAVGTRLFEKQGRQLALTASGEVILRYANDIFTLGGELAEVVRRGDFHAPVTFTVGIVDVMPKLVAYHVLEPVLELAPQVRLVCKEGELDDLLANLAVHGLDMVLSDRPLPENLHVRAYNHALGDSGVSFLGPPHLAEIIRAGFPGSLDDAPMLLPTPGTTLRNQLDRWFEANAIEPQVIAEFDDSALLKAFGQAGKGILPTPNAVDEEVARHYGLEVIGRTDDVRAQYFAISVERRVKHPAVLAVTQTARSWLFTQ